MDIGPKNGGDKTLAELESQHGKLPHTTCAFTGSGGWHHHFQYPSQPIKCKTNLFQGIDVKTDGGYVIVPPSLHASGNHYEWLVTLDEVPLAPVPDWLLQAMITPKTPETPTPNNGTAVFSEGQRNAELTRIAGRLRRQGLGMEALSAALVALNNEKCSPPLPQAEVMQIAKSISSKECPEFAALVPPTDSGNAELFATMFSDSVRYDHQRGLWLLWDKHWWRPDEERQVLLLAKDVARERQRCLSDHSSKEARKFALTSESKARLEATLALAQAEQPISDAGKNWDADPWLLGVCAAIIALNTTMRGGELKALRWMDVNLVDRLITVRKSKTDAGLRVIPINANALDAFLELRDRAQEFNGIEPEHYIFPTCEHGIPDPTSPMKSWRTAWRALTTAITCPVCGLVQNPGNSCRKKRCKADISKLQSKLTGFRFHDMRHSAITELAESTEASEQTILSIAGHVSRKMLEHYSHIRNEAKRKALDALAAVGTTAGHAAPEPAPMKSKSKSSDQN